MALFQKPFSLELPVRIGVLDVRFFINENLYVKNEECVSVTHNHHDFELRYVASGSCNQTIGTDIYPVLAGELLLVYPLEYHRQTQLSDQAQSTQYNLRFYLEPPTADGADSVRQRAYSSMVNLLRDTRKLRDTELSLLPFFQQLTEEIYQKRTGYITNLKSLCCLIMTEIIRLSGKPHTWIFPAEELKYRGYERTVIDEFFRGQYLTDITIQDLADDMRVSVRQVNRIIHRMFGMSFTQKLTEMRIWEAAHQMMTTHKSLAQISKDCGFPNYNTFFVNFQKIHGMAPTEFRKPSLPPQNSPLLSDLHTEPRETITPQSEETI